MPLDVETPPPAAVEAVQSVIADLATHAGFGTPTLRLAAPEQLALSTPHPIAVMPLDRLRDGADLGAVAQMKGWRFLVHEGDRVVASTDAVERESGRFEFGQINEGPFNAAIEQAVRRAETLDTVRQGRFTPSVLLVPALYVVAVWLRDKGGRGDLVLPLPPAPGGLKPFEPLPAADFLAALKRLAERVPPEGRDPAGRSGG